jgi:hypothetical protein
MSHIIVGRDRAHVRTLLEEYPGEEIISASAFFDKIRIMAFLANSKLRRDDHAPILFAHEILVRTQAFPLHYASHLAQVYASLFHGTIPPQEALVRLEGKDFSFSNTLAMASLIQEQMQKHNLATNVSALYHSWRICEEKKIIPPALLKSPRISLRYLIDLTALETEVIKCLSRLGLYFDICFPLDFSKRKLNVAVDFAAKQFEKNEDLTNIDLHFDNLAHDGPLSALISGLLVDGQNIHIAQEHCEIYEAPNFAEETAHVAARIARLKTKNPACSIALVMRAYDQRASIFKRALIAHNINVKDRKGQPLTQSPAGILLQNILNARLNSLPKSTFLSLVTNPLFACYLSNNFERSEIYELLNLLGIDDRHIETSDNYCRYKKALEQYQNKKFTAPEIFYELLTKINNIIYNLKTRDTYEGYLASLLSIINTYFRHDSSVEVLLELIKALSHSASHEKSSVLDLKDFANLLLDSLNRTTVARSDHHDQGAVEFLLLPELLGRHFDHVCIADVSFGRMPKSPQTDPLFSDEQRILLNKALGFQVLRVFIDDPFEPLPVPPRQALEPFWFAAALASASQSVSVSYSAHDPNGVEQAPSEFFIWLKNNIIIKPEEEVEKLCFTSTEHERFLHGKSEYLNNINNYAYSTALKQRKNAYKNAQSGPYAFAFEREQLLTRFDGRLAPKPWRALTPTMIEAFASCSFFGLLSRIIKLPSQDQEPDDLDARILGHIAHQVLERFFNESLKKFETQEEKLKLILKHVGESYEQSHYIKSSDIFWCYLDWLYEVLLKLISQIINHNILTGVPLAREQAFGLALSGLPGLKLKTSTHNYLLGGVIDRSDRADSHVIITDYKLSSLANLKVSGSASAMLKTNFQAPIYLRLAAQAWAHNNPDQVSFIFASIRDGQLLPALSSARHPELFERIFDDEHVEGLGQSLNKIFAPISQGHVLAREGEQCALCDFSYICRRVEVKKIKENNYE